MHLQIAKWGNSLALRIPTDYVRQADLKEGDCVEASLTIDGGICIRAAKWNRAAFARYLEAVRAAMPMSTPAIDELRQGARY